MLFDSSVFSLLNGFVKASVRLYVRLWWKRVAVIVGIKSERSQMFVRSSTGSSC